MCTFCGTPFYVPYCTFRHIFKEKCPLSGAKTQANLGTFLFYVDIGTYWCVFITLLQKRIAAVHKSNIRGLSLKVNALLCWKYALHQTQPLTYTIVLTNENWYKNVFVDTTMPFQLPYMQIWTALLNRDYMGFEPKLLAS